MPLIIQDHSVRGCFVPRPGCAFIEADVEALEMVTLAQVEIWLLKDDRKAKQINSGMDLHCVTGSAIAHTTYDPFRKRVKAKDPVAVNCRQLAKVANFGKPGGMADTTLVGFARASYGIKLGATDDNPRPSREVAEAEAIRLGGFWRRANPNDQAYLERMRHTKGADGMYHVVLGHPSIGTVLRRGKATYCAACNSPFQGLGAIAAGVITFELQRLSYTVPASPLYGCRLAIHAYDSWLLECPLDRITEAGAELERVIREFGAQKVPDVQMRAEAAAMLDWDKSAAKVTTSDGRLLIWGTPECNDRLKELKAA
jgi:DNA polymerase I-like protein with 3'-5' exonuclease and polymerase domains